MAVGDVAAAPARIPVYLFAGQSNMLGAYTHTPEVAAYKPKLDVPLSDVLFWGPTSDAPRRWGSLSSSTENRNNAFGAGFGPELSAAHGLRALHPTGRMAIFKYAVNGSDLGWMWRADRKSGLYRRMLDRYNYATARLRTETGLSPYLAGVFWMQGEADGTRRSWANAYGTNLTELIEGVRRDFRAPEVPFVMGHIQDARKWYPDFAPYTHIVRAKQFEVAKADPHTFLVSTDGLERRATISPVHFNTKGTIDLGYRFVRNHYGL
ncbi:MAG: sialate O-acetylesterase [Actinomycetota bacterium]